MHAERTERVYISRLSSDADKRGQRVYVTGPHFGQGLGAYHRGAVFSSTQDKAKASTFERWVAEGMIARKSWQVAEVEPVDA
jgi:hypothetical protein